MSTNPTTGHSLSICRTCPRDRRDSGGFGVDLAAHLDTRLTALGVSVLLVTCLGACKQASSIALDAPGKARLRVSGLDIEAAEHIFSLVHAYLESASGMLHVAGITAISPKLLRIGSQPTGAP